MKLNLASQRDQLWSSTGNSVAVTESRKGNAHLYHPHSNALLHALEKWSTEQEDFTLHKPL